ncbi:MAG: hypothetical protein GOP50_01990, partial [Candidatus Heimdallarchaeota archaeon]|nr:hypothetical protein [Candidatus Heimdallarchaeota archaeon]
MIKNNRKNGTKIVFVLLIIVGICTMSSSTFYVNAEIEGCIANLVLKTTGGGVRPDYGLYIAQYLRSLGIEVEVKVDEWFPWPYLIPYHDYDLGIMSISGGGLTPDMRELYTEDGDLNVFLLGTDMPYGNQSEVMQDVGVTITDVEARRQHYYDWQQLMMDYIVPMLPLYSPNSYTGTWSNTEGYDAKWGLIDSLPYMSYDGYHEGQVTLDEINLADANWRELNPLFTDDTGSEFIWELISEQLLHFGPDFYPMNTGLLQGWTKIDDFHYKFLMRDNVYWNPSYNVTGRTVNSIPLNDITDEELMVGLKNGGFSNGTNQEVTAKDAVFTLLCWANPVISEYTGNHEW